MNAHLLARPLGLAALAAAALVLLPAGAQAATATDTMAVSATVQTACVLTANPLAFGNYNPTSATPTDMNTTVSVTCTTGTSYTLGLSAGTTSGSTVTARKMNKSGTTLNYSLYQDSSHTTNWGNTPNTDTPASAVAGTGAATITVYGRIPALQNVSAGNYTDSVTVTVNY